LLISAGIFLFENWLFPPFAPPAFAPVFAGTPFPPIVPPFDFPSPIYLSV